MKNIGEFYITAISLHIFNLNERDIEWLNTCRGLDINDGVFSFNSIKDDVRLSITRDDDAYWGAMSIRSESGQFVVYQGNDELSSPEPSKYLALIFSQLFQLLLGKEFGGTTCAIEEDYAIPSEVEWEEARAKLFGKS